MVVSSQSEDVVEVELNRPVVKSYRMQERVLFVLLLCVWLWLEVVFIGGMKFEFGAAETIDQVVGMVFLSGFMYGVVFWVINTQAVKRLRRLARWMSLCWWHSVRQHWLPSRQK